MKDFFVRQRDFRQCGIASLAMICAILGKKVSLRYLETICPPSKEGVSIRALKECSRMLGLKARAGRLDIENLRKVPFPALLFWDGNHYVVLYGTDRRGEFLIADPMSSKIRLGESELKKHWLINGKDSGIAMVFDKTENFSCETGFEKKGDSILDYIKSYAGPYLRYHVAFLIGLFIAAGIQVLFPFLTQFIVDKGIPLGNVRLIWMILAGEVIIVLGKTVSDYVRRWLLVKITNRIELVMKGDFLIKFLSLPMTFYEKKTTGDILQRIGDFQRIQSFLTSQLLGSVYCIILLIGLLTVMGIYSMVVFLIIVSFIAAYSGWTICFLKKRKAMDMLFFKANSESSDAIMELVNSTHEIKVQGCHRYQLLNWEKRTASVMDVQIRNLVLQQSLDGGKTFLREVRNLIVNVIAALLVIEGTLSLGEMFAIMFIVGQISSPVDQLVNYLLDIQDVLISMERISDVRDEREETEVFGDTRLSEIHEKDIEYRNVSFRYPNDLGHAALDDISFRIPAGKITALVGSSGSGKTTLIRLLLGYYRCSSGKISVAGHDIDSLDMDDWRSHVGVVLQNGKIFNDSISRNISLCENPEDVDWDRMREAVKIADIGDFIERKVSGWDTILGKDGEGLSQGQKQRILIARAIYRNPDLLIMDEATNSLDSETEKRISANLSEFYRDRTVILIAHRLSTVTSADNIIVLDKGRIIEQGTHKDLVRQRGAYYNLVRSQLNLGSEA